MSKYTTSETDIPKRVTDDQYDKLMRELWEMRQKFAGINQISYDNEQLAKLQDDIGLLGERLTEIERNLDTVMRVAGVLATAEQFRMKKFVDKLPDKVLKSEDGKG